MVKAVERVEVPSTHLPDSAMTKSSLSHPFSNCLRSMCHLGKTLSLKIAGCLSHISCTNTIPSWLWASKAASHPLKTKRECNCRFICSNNWTNRRHRVSQFCTTRLSKDKQRPAWVYQWKTSPGLGHCLKYGKGPYSLVHRNLLSMSNSFQLEILEASKTYLTYQIRSRLKVNPSCTK